MNRPLSSLSVLSPCVRPAFTLVEILISILILALGVLGLGALFPVIIREQRQGTDAAAGVSVSNAVRSVISRSEWGAALDAWNGKPHPVLVRPVSPPGPTSKFPAGSPAAGTQFLWDAFRNPYYRVDPNSVAASAISARTSRIAKGLGTGFQKGSTESFQDFGQGEWYMRVVDPATGTLQLGYPGVPSLPSDPPPLTTGPGNAYYDDAATVRCKSWVDVPLAARLYPSNSNTEPQFVWDVAFQRVSNFEHTHDPIEDAIRAVVFVRRLDPRIRITGAATTIRDAITNGSLGVQPADRRFPVSEIISTGDPALDGSAPPTTDSRYSAIKTCEIEFFFNPTQPTMTHRDRLYQPQQWAYGAPSNLPRIWAQMKQPGQKLVDNLGNVYTVVGSGTELGVGSGEYLKIDPPVPESVTADRASPATASELTTYLDVANPPRKPYAYARRAIRQVAFTPQIPVSVTLVEIARGSGQ